MVAVRMMQVAVDQVVDMIAMRNRFMSTAGAMHVTGLVASAGMSLRAFIGVCFADLDHVLFHATVGVLMMQMTVVQVIGMAVVIHSRVAAVFAMLMIVVGMFGGHGVFL